MTLVLEISFGETYQKQKQKGKNLHVTQCQTKKLPFKSNKKVAYRMGEVKKKKNCKSSIELKVNNCIKTHINFKTDLKVAERSERRTRWQRSRWMWSTSLSTDTSGIHL